MKEKFSRNEKTVPDLEWSKSLYGLRGLAALVVVLSHLSKKGYFLLPGLDFSGTGKIGVWLFFVLSAFTLTRQFMEWEARRQAGRWRTFFVRRAFRILPLFWFALCVDYIFNRISIEHVINGLRLSSAPNHLWTVPVEFQFYFLIPLLGILGMRLTLRARSMVVSTLILLAIFASMFDEVPLSVWPFLPCFLAGVWLAYFTWKLPVTKISLPFIKAWVFVALAMSVIATPAVIRTIGLPFIDVNSLRNNSTVFGLIFPGCILAALILPSWRRVLGCRMAVWFGSLSYSIYLLHPLVLDAFVAMKIAPSWGGVLCVVVIVIVGWFGFVSIERPARRLGYKLTPMP